MRVLKRVSMTALFVMAIGMTSCTKTDIAEEDALIETQSIDKKAIKNKDRG